MKIIECRNCGNTNLIYKNGFVVCQCCDSKYSANEIGWDQTPESKFVTIHSAPWLRKSHYIKAYKNGELISSYNGHNDVKVSIDSDSLFYFEPKMGKGISAKIDNNQDSHIFLWFSQLYGGLDGFKSTERDATQTLEKRNERIQKEKLLRAMLMIPIINLVALFVFGFHAITKKRKEVK